MHKTLAHQPGGPRPCVTGARAAYSEDPLDRPSLTLIAAYIEDPYDGMRRLQREERKRIHDSHLSTGR